MIVAAAISRRISAILVSPPLVCFFELALLFGSVLPALRVLLVDYQPALPSGGGIVPTNAMITRIGRRAAITHLASFGFAAFLACRRQDVRAVAMPFAIHGKIKAVGVCLTIE